MRRRGSRLASPFVGVIATAERRDLQAPEITVAVRKERPRASAVLAHPIGEAD